MIQEGGGRIRGKGAEGGQKRGWYWYWTEAERETKNPERERGGRKMEETAFHNWLWRMWRSLASEQVSWRPEAWSEHTASLSVPPRSKQLQLVWLNRCSTLLLKNRTLTLQPLHAYDTQWWAMHEPQSLTPLDTTEMDYYNLGNAHTSNTTFTRIWKNPQYCSATAIKVSILNLSAGTSTSDTTWKWTHTHTVLIVDSHEQEYRICVLLVCQLA